MALKDFFKKDESLIALDIGASSLKLVELELTDGRPQLINVATAPLTPDIFSGHQISKPEVVAEQIQALLDANEISDRRVITAVPGPSAFTKRIKVPKMSPAELAENIQFEAGNSIPHNLDAVRLDYHVLGASSKGQLDVLVVAVKNEVIDGLVNCLSMCGLEAAVVDVDYFALQNVFELGYAELISKTVALINIGARYSCINICRDGQTLFTGDISVGGKSFTDALMNGLGLTYAQAEDLKRKSLDADNSDEYIAHGIIQKNIETVSTEFNRQLSFFWSASGADEGIDQILLSGGGSLLPGLKEAIAERTGIECATIQPLLGIDVGESFDKKFLEEVTPLMSVAMGLAIRQPGDKIIPEYDPES